MRPNKTLAALETRRVERMAEAARDVGHELPRRRADVLNEFRRGLTDIAQRSADDLYLKGFCDALEHVTASFLAESAHDEDLSRAKAVVEAKPRWAKVLRALAEGHGLPRDIAEASGIAPSSVTRTLQELEDASLVERPPPSQEADGRQRPCVLTSLGDELARRLFKDADRRIAAVRDALPVINQFYSSLISQRRVVSIELLQLAETKIGRGSAKHLVEVLLGAAEQTALAVRDPDGAIAVEALDLSRLLTETCGHPDRFHSMRSIVASPLQTYVFSSRFQYLWDQWIRMGRLDRVVTLTGADLRFGPPLSSPYQVLYDDVVMAHRDSEQELAQDMLAGARRRLCLVPSASQAKLPSSITPVPVAAS
jgi:DNA-binding MarR family transcriptional regulator